MRADEFISEARVHPNMQAVMAEKGYKFIGHGQDQDAYFAPDGTILKIFGWDERKGKSGFTRAQDSFITFAEYCRKNPSNQFLPDFSAWTPFEFDGRTYLQIKCERLFPLEGKYDSLGDELEMLVDYYIEPYGWERGLPMYISKSGTNDYEDSHKLIMLLGTDGLVKLAKTLDEVVKLGNKNGYRIDLHGGNFMLGSDGHIVINDPYWTGSYR